MFKCKDCNKEYIKKPDFCDCGNDTFDEICPAKINKDLPSVIFFIACIILSLIILIFPTNKKSEDISQVKQETKKSTLKNINELWNDSAPKSANFAPGQDINNRIVQNKKSSSPKVASASAQKVTPKQKAVPSHEPVQKVAPARVQKKSSVQNTQKITSPPVSQPVPSHAQKNLPEPSSKNSSESKTKMAEQLSLELKNYKINLRNKIASNIAFAQVVGDGSCAIKFKISPGGGLINKQFSIQSDNDSLNDVVYAGMGAVRSFNPPPENYGGEYLELKVKMYGGSFEVTLK